MRNIVTLHQPNYLPWIGLFSKISQTDCLVVMDTVQYIKRGVTHRNKIRTGSGSAYLTIPISKEFAMSRIMDVQLPADKSWKKDHWRAILHNYVKSGFFADYQDFFEAIYKNNFNYLWQLNMEILNYLLKCFRIDVEVIMTSSLNLDPELKHTDLIIAILESIGARTYLSGPSGKNYLEEDRFRLHNIDLKFALFEHPVYPQRYPGFEPNLAAIDLLFNVGPGSSDLIRKSGSMEP